MEANKILTADILDIIFEGRNKDYGAYNLRQTYNRRIMRALVITAGVALLALLGPFLASKLSSSNHNKQKQTEVTLQEIKQEEKKIEPPPPPPPPKPDPPKVEMKQFTPPVIKKDEEVQKPPPPQEELEKVKIADVNQKGVEENNVPTAPVVDQGKQIVEEKKPDEDENKIFDKVEIEASFPGGDAKWRQFLEKNLNASTPVDNGAPEGTYTVTVQFIVDKEGNISDVHSINDPGYGMGQEAVHVIQKGPKWNPANQNGKAVKAYRRQPITFVVQGEQ